MYNNFPPLSSLPHLVENDLWRHVLRRAAECPRLITHIQLLGETKVDQFYVAVIP